MSVYLVHCGISQGIEIDNIIRCCCGLHSGKACYTRFTSAVPRGSQRVGNFQTQYMKIYL